MFRDELSEIGCESMWGGHRPHPTLHPTRGGAGFPSPLWRANGGARFDLSKFMQRKLLGFVLRRVHEAHDFLAILRAETQKVPSSGRASKENRDYWLRINNAMLPWMEILGHIARHSQLNKFSREGCLSRKANFVGGSYTLYARVNLRSRDMYVGQTENFPVRFAQEHNTSMGPLSTM